MTTEMNEADERAKRKAGTPGVAAAAAAAGAAAGMVAGTVASALLDDRSRDEAAPTARDPFDDLVPPPAAPAAAAAPTTEAPAEAEAPAVSAPTAPPVVEPTPATAAATMPTASATADVVTEPVHVAPAARVANDPTPEPVAAEPPATPPVAAEPPAEPVAEQPVAVDPPVADPTDVEPPAVDEPVITEPVITEPVVNLDPGGTGGMAPEPVILLDPITGLVPGAGMPPVTDGPIDDPFATPMLPDPGIEAPTPFDAPTDGFDGGGVPGPERPVMPAQPVAVDPIAPMPEMPVTPEPIIVDVVVQNAAIDAIGQFGKYVEGFGNLGVRALDNEDRMELWHAIRQLDPSLKVGPIAGLSDFIEGNATLEKIADHYNVNLAQLATMVQIEDDATDTTIASMMAGAIAPNMTITPGLLSFDVDGQTFQITSNGQLLMEDTTDGQEGSFVPIDVGDIDYGPITGLTPSNWGWLTGIDDGPSA